MTLSKLEIEKIGDLARIALDEKEKDSFLVELSQVIDYFKILQGVDTTLVDLNLTENEITNTSRQDKDEDSGAQNAILANAPMTEEKFIKVKSVL